MAIDATTTRSSTPGAHQRPMRPAAHHPQEPPRAPVSDAERCKDDLNLSSCKETKQVVDKTLAATNQGATVANWAGTVAGNDRLGGISNSSAAAINVARGLVDITATGKVDSQSIAALATGAGTMLINRVPGAEFLVLFGSAAALHYNRQKLADAVNSRDPRALTGSIASTVQGAIGFTAATTTAASELAEQGVKLGWVSEKSLAQVQKIATSASNVAGKSIIPFSVVGTVLSGWDWHKREEHLDALHKRRLQYEQKHPTDHGTDIRLKQKEREEIANTHLSGASFGLSGVSTTALTVAAVVPVTAPVAVPVAVVAGVGSAVTGLLAEPAVRNWTARKLHIK